MLCYPVGSNITSHLLLSKSYNLNWENRSPDCSPILRLSFSSTYASFSKVQNKRKENHKSHVPFVDGYSSLLGASEISICSWRWNAFVTHALSWFRLPCVLCTSTGRITAGSCLQTCLGVYMEWIVPYCPALFILLEFWRHNDTPQESSCFLMKCVY